MQSFPKASVFPCPPTPPEALSSYVMDYVHALNMPCTFCSRDFFSVTLKCSHFQFYLSKYSFLLTEEMINTPFLCNIYELCRISISLSVLLTTLKLYYFRGVEVGGGSSIIFKHLFYSVLNCNNSLLNEGVGKLDGGNSTCLSPSVSPSLNE